MKKTIRPLLLIVLLLSAACAEQRAVDNSGTTGPAPDAGEDVTIEPPATSEYTALLEQAGTLLRQRQLLSAASILRDIDAGKLAPQQRADQVLLETELLYLQGRSETALQQLQRALPQFDDIEPDLQWQLQQWHLRLLLSNSRPVFAAQQAQQLLETTSAGEQHRQLIRFIWLNLNRSTTQELQTQLLKRVSPNWRGWLELALLATHVTASPDVQVAELELWRQRFTNHPAQQALPGGLELLPQLQLQAPRQIALILPLSGPLELLGRAVLDGFLAAQFESRRKGWPAISLSVIDSTGFADVDGSYNAAVASGAQLVIGPLEREQLNQWQPQQPLPVPLLSLNWFDGTTPGGGQMALSPVDEARQLARLAFDGGARHALLIRPQGSWGQATSTALLAQWQELEGSVQAVATFTGQADYSSSLQAALNLQQSRQRATRIRQLMGEPLEFSPRRRRDLDVIFLLAGQPRDARSLKPLIAFHYAADLPVYSTSHIFSGRAEPRLDRDLNGIRLIEIPWIVAPDADISTPLYNSGADATLANMHALGVDAFMVNWRLQQLAADPGNVYRGQTGLLHMDQQRRLHRELVPTIMRGGLPEIL